MPVSIYAFLFLPCFVFEILQKNDDDALRVLDRMKDANIKPDSITFNYLIGNSKTEEDITKVCWISCVNNFLYIHF